MKWVDDAIEAVRAHDRSRPRSQQAEVGWSEVGGCRAYMGFRLDGAYGDETDKAAALRGTAIDAYYGPILAEWWGARYQVETVYAGIPGHADLVGADWVLDMKAPELANARAWAADLSTMWQKRVQGHGYCAGLVDAGELPPDATVRLLIMPTSGTFRDWYGFEEPFDRTLADAGAERLDQVRLKLETGEPLGKDKPYGWCQDWCPFFSQCRTPAEASELAEITDPEIAWALKRYGELNEIAGPASKEKEELAPLLRGYRGRAHGWKVSTGKAGEGRMVLDEDQVRADYAARGLEPPEVLKPGQAGKLSVTRIKTQEATG